MDRHAVDWIFGAIAALGLAAISWVLGMNRLPTRVAAEEAGMLVQWFFTWGMIWTIMLAAVALAAFLIVTGVNGVRGSK
jgi:hypothetical protein